MKRNSVKRSKPNNNATMLRIIVVRCCYDSVTTNEYYAINSQIRTPIRFQEKRKLRTRGVCVMSVRASQSNAIMYDYRDRQKDGQRGGQRGGQRDGRR